MNIQEALMIRSGGVCELCSDTNDLSVYEVPPSDGSAEQSILLCGTCLEQIEDPEKTDPNHWRCLNDSMWSTEPAVQVMAYRMLMRITTEEWPQNLIDMLYMEPEVKTWADASIGDTTDDTEPVRDSNGAILEGGDSVTIIKDLDVKGAGFTAKRGTVVKNISLNGIEGQIEGRVNGTRIVLLSKFLKKI